MLTKQAIAAMGRLHQIATNSTNDTVLASHARRVLSPGSDADLASALNGIATHPDSQLVTPSLRDFCATAARELRADNSEMPEARKAPSYYPKADA
jgi:hypothetical protein